MSNISIKQADETTEQNNLFPSENDWALILLMFLFPTTENKGDEENV